MLMQYGKISLSTQWIQWSQPILFDNGTLGGNAFACGQSSGIAYAGTAWKCFNNTGSTNDGIQITSPGEEYIVFYNPDPLKVTSLTLYTRSNNLLKSYTLSGSNNNSDWTIIGSYTNSSSTVWTQSINNINAYKYYRLIFNNERNQVLDEIKITAVTQSNALNTIIFPTTFSSIHYGVAFSYINGSSSSAYISSKSKSGLSLDGVDISSSSASYLTIGY